jgi:hypothetical protein
MNNYEVTQSLHFFKMLSFEGTKSRHRFRMKRFIRSDAIASSLQGEGLATQRFITLKEKKNAS